MATFRNEESHLGRGSVSDGVDKHAPRVLFLLTPAVGPAQDDGVGLHSAKACCLDPEKYKGRV